MSSLTRITSTALPAFIGIGFAWLAIRVISNEKQLTQRKIELEQQIGVNYLGTSERNPILKAKNI